MDTSQYEEKIQKRTRAINIGWAHLPRLVAKERVSQALYIYIVRCVDILQEIYPDMWDIQFEYEPDIRTYTNAYGHNSVLEQEYFKGVKVKRLYFVIKFPHITVTNSKGYSLDIEDLFVRLPLTINHKGRPHHFETLQGIKMTFNQLEAIKGYQHSHLHSANVSSSGNKYSEFCTGSGDINNVLSLLNTDIQNIEMFSLYLTTLIPYLEWESLEGVPYLKLQDVFGIDVAVGSLGSVAWDRVYNNLIAQLKDKVIEPDLDWYYNYETSLYEIKDNQKLEQFLLKQTHYNTTGRPDVFCHKGITGVPLQLIQYPSEDAIASHKRMIERPINYIIFKGEKIFAKVVQKDVVLPQLPYFIHPTIKKYVKSKLELLANEEEVKNYATRRLNSLGYQ